LFEICTRYFGGSNHQQVLSFVFHVNKGQIMKSFSKALLAGSIVLSAPAFAVDIWQSNSFGPQQGICSAIFSFDSLGGKEVLDMKVSIVGVNKAGKKVTSGVLEVPKLGVTPVDRFTTAALETNELCGSDNLTMVVEKATGTIEGKKVDLLKSKMLSARIFKPVKIGTGK
jgi:hypothetical protein